MLDQRGQLLRAAVGFATCSMPSFDRALWALRTWLDSWSGIAHVTVGMHGQGYDLQLTQYDDRGWRVTFYTTGMEHSPTSATGTDAVASGAGRRMASVAQRKRRGGGWTIAAKMDWWRRRLVQKSRNAHFTKPRNRENVMLTRRAFTGVVSCAICAVASEFMATEAEAQAAPPPATASVTRKILSQSDGPAAGYETLLVEATIEAGVAVGRHTHPGIESAYVLEGGFELPIQGQPTRTIRAGDAFQIPPETPHAGGKPGNAKSRILITYVVQKGKPLASPA